MKKHDGDRYSRSPALREQVKVNRERARFRNRSYVWEHLNNNPCISCGESNPIVLEFDHIDPSNKKANISAYMNRGVTLELLKQEIEKCQMLCANCHRAKTAKDNGWWKDFLVK